MLFNGLKALAPYSHTNVHAKYWDRWGDKNDVQRSMRIMLAGGFKGTFALEYEAGPLNGIEGAKYLYKEVLAALSTPVPVVVASRFQPSLPVSAAGGGANPYRSRATHAATARANSRRSDSVG